MSRRPAPGSSWLAPASAVAIVAAASLAGGCEDLDEYRANGADAVFRGAVVGSDGDSFIRRGFPPGTELRLTFDPSLAASVSPPPGTLTTNDACAGAPSFDGTPLEPIAPLAHDALSQYDFPGGGRVRNYAFVARPTAGCLAGRDAMVFLSLMDEGDVEVRIIAGSGDEARNDRFGVFVTTKSAP